MQRRPPRPEAGRLVRTTAAFLMLSAAGCRGGGADESSSRSTDPEARALTPEEIEASAEAITPEVAESLGIVDTTMRAPAPQAPDTVQSP